MADPTAGLNMPPPGHPIPFRKPQTLICLEHNKVMIPKGRSDRYPLFDKYECPKGCGLFYCRTDYILGFKVQPEPEMTITEERDSNEPTPAPVDIGSDIPGGGAV